MTSLKTRLSWSLTLSLIVLLTLQWLVVSYAISSLTENQLFDRLERESENLLSGIQLSGTGDLVIDSGRMGSVYKRPFSGSYYVALTDQQEIVSQSLWDYSFSIQPAAVGDIKKMKLLGPEAQPLLVSVHGYKKDNQTITIAIAENIEPLNSNIRRFQFIYGTISVLGLLLILIVQRKMILNALKPLQKIHENIAKLERGETTLLDLQTPLEITPLIEHINRLLTAMDRKYQRSRDSIGNLAHALKTRLTLLNQYAENLDTDRYSNFKTLIFDSTQKLNDIIERELKRARLMGDMRPGRRVDLNLSIPDIVNTLRQIYLHKNISISWEMISNPQFNGDTEDFVEMLGNLLDNACKWSNSRVSLKVIGGEKTTFVIEDDGAGSTIYDMNNLTRRGYRADESRPGSGLGLAIVNDIVESYNGTIVFGKSDTLGGMRVEVDFKQTSAQ